MQILVKKSSLQYILQSTDVEVQILEFICALSHVRFRIYDRFGCDPFTIPPRPTSNQVVGAPPNSSEACRRKRQYNQRRSLCQLGCVLETFQFGLFTFLRDRRMSYHSTDCLLLKSIFLSCKFFYQMSLLSKIISHLNVSRQRCVCLVFDFRVSKF